MNRLYMIGNTHFDPVWLWTWDEALASIRSTFRAALDRMDEDADFIYSFACPPVFEQIERIDPALMKRIAARVAEGRWALDEGLWVQPDCFSGLIESYIRQGLHGQRFLRTRFGKRSDTVFNIDSFGHPLMLAQVFVKLGMPYGVISRPDKRDLDLGDSLFVWRAPDGSEMLMARSNIAGAVYPVDTDKMISDALPKLDEHDHDLLLVYGVTNHGGAPTKQALAAIHKHAGETGGRVVFSNTTGFFSRQKTDGLPVWDQEIPIRNFGVFVNRPDVKQAARRTEIALMNAERAALLAALLTGAPDQTRALARPWQTLLYNQFHDTLGGAAITDGETDALHQLGGARASAEEILHLSLQRIAADVNLANPDCPDAAWTLMIWNLNASAYSGYIEAEVQWAWEFDWYEGEIALTDENGHDVPCQLIRPRSVIPGFRSRFVFKADIPAMGWRALRVRQRKAAFEGVPAAASESSLDNGRLRAVISENSVRIEDAQTGEILLRECARPVAVADESDVWAFNFTGYGAEEPFALESARVIERGPLRAAIKLRWTYRRSFVEQTLRLCAGESAVEGHIRVDWNERHKALKLRYASSHDRLVTATPGYGAERAFDGRELPCGGWFDLTDEAGQGALTLSDAFFGFDAPEGGVVRATVLRSPIVGDLRVADLPDDDYEYMSQGVFEGRWRVSFHGAQDSAGPWRAYEAFINPPVITDEAAHPGAMPLTACALTLEGSQNVLATAIKRAEDGTGDAIVRLQNFGGARESVCVSPAGYDSFGAVLAPYEIRTMRHTAAGWVAVNMLEEEE